jgi:hypothetical protein
MISQVITKPPFITSSNRGDMFFMLDYAIRSQEKKIEVLILFWLGLTATPSNALSEHLLTTKTCSAPANKKESNSFTPI